MKYLLTAMMLLMSAQAWSCTCFGTSFLGALVFAGGVIWLRDFSFACDSSVDQIIVLRIELNNLVDR
jgi:hypothetical protein